MSRFLLICTMLVAALSLSGGQQFSGGRSAELAALTGVVVEPRSDDTGSDDTGFDDAGTTPALRFGWPLTGSPTVVRAFHPPAFRYGPGHRGVDLATVAGAPVLAAEAGTVAFAGTVAGYGVVSVEHSGGLRTTYEPVSPTVTIGAEVARGERIGTAQSGHPGCPVAVCLHWGVLLHRGVLGRRPHQDRQYLDPLLLLATARVRLLPLDGLLLMPGVSAGGGFQHLAPEP